MKKFLETDVEATFEWLETNDNQADQILRELDSRQPYLLGYLFSDSFETLSENEKELLVFATLVIYKCTQSEVQREISYQEIEEAEANNYTLLDEKLTYKEQMDIFFNNYIQEDLLAFVEDFIDDDEGDEFAVTPESKLPLFLALKSIIDVVTK